MKFKFSTHVRMVFALALVAGFVGLTLSLNPGVASAVGGRDNRNADVSFTKWIIDSDWPTVGVQIDMLGVVTGGDAGSTGTFTGEAFLQSDGSIYAFYHVKGKHHSFTASVHVVGTEITGVVTKGWLNGSPVTGEFGTQPVCGIPTPGNVLDADPTDAVPGPCFPVTLHIDGGSKD